MNVTVYLFGKFGGDYTQYPDDYTREIFSDFEENIKSPIQLMIHRHDALIYYGYLRKLTEQGRYIGIAFVFNGAMCTDISALCKLCEDNITNWVVNGEILEFADNGDIISKIDELYKTASEFKRLSENLASQISSSKLSFKKLPPINYAISANAVKTFNIEGDSNTFNEALNDYNNIYIYSDSTSEALASFSDKLRRLSKENADLKAGNAIIVNQENSSIVKSIIKVVIIIVSICLILGAGILFLNHKKKIYRQQIEADYQAFKDSCNVHFKQGRCDDCRNDIEEMKRIEEQNSWLKAFSEYYSSIVEEKCK